MDEITMMSWTENIREAFGELPEIEQGIISAINQNRQLGKLFDNIAAYTISQQNIIKELTKNSENAAGTAGTLTKKRKLDDPDGNLTQNRDLWPAGPYSTVKELAFTIPQRKRLTLEIGDATAGLRARLPATNAVEFGIKWSQIQQVTCLPVPDKAQLQYAFCIFPAQNLGITAGPGAADTPDQMSFTVPNTNAKPGIFSDDVKAASDGSIKDVLVRMLNERLQKQSAKVIEPAESEFFSKVPQTLRKEEKAVHVKAHQGSKEGLLFFLSTGIVWAFKKPLCFFPFDAIDSISYSSIVQRTFNLNIDTLATETETKSKTFEFSHIDIIEYEGIDEYIGRHGLKDASMTEQRRARNLNHNGKNGAQDAVKEDSPGELEKAIIEAENAAADDDHDEDEEDDENFDPGSEGESEGEGASEEDEESD